MVIGSLGSALLIVGITGRQVGKEVVFGMLGPLVAAGVSWALVERTYLRSPERLTGLMIGGFATKMVFFGGYVAVMLKVLALHPVPFVVSFTGYFIVLYAVEALLMRRLFAGG